VAGRQVLAQFARMEEAAAALHAAGYDVTEG
jgi:hypothetical protein